MTTLQTPTEFRSMHGDPAGWCGAEVDEYLDDCLATLPTPGPAPALLHLLAGGTPATGKTTPTANAA